MKTNDFNQGPNKQHLEGGVIGGKDTIPNVIVYPDNTDYTYDDESNPYYYEELNSDGALSLAGMDMIAYNQDGSIVNFTNFDFSKAKIYEDYYSNDTNYTDIIYAEDSFSTAGRHVALAFFILCFVVGFIGNVLVIYTVARYVTMRRVTYLYLLNLSVAGLLYLLVCLPTLTVSYALVDWPFGLFFCKLVNYIMSVSMSVSVLSIMVTGLERYVAVMYPVKYRYISTNKKAIFVICIIWGLSLLVMTPRLFLFDQMLTLQYSGISKLCTRIASHSRLQLDTTLNFVFMYLLPIAVLSICHIRIGMKLWKSSRPGAANLAVRDRRRIAKIVFAITAVFVLGWLPLHIYHMVEDFDKGNVLFGEVVDRGTIVLIFSFCANALNPVFYFIISSSFRKHFKKAIRCWNPTLVTSSEIAETASLTRGHGQQEYRRPPPVLLPRPASLLPDLPTPANVKAVSFREFPILPQTSLSCTKPLLNELDCQSNLAESSSDVRPQTSPLTIENVSDIEVTSCPKPDTQTTISGLVSKPTFAEQRSECADLKEISPKQLTSVSMTFDDVSKSQNEVLTLTKSPDILELIESNETTDMSNNEGSNQNRILSSNPTLSSYQHRYHVTNRDQSLTQRQNELCSRQSKTRTLAQFANRCAFKDISETVCNTGLQLQNRKSSSHLFLNSKNSSTKGKAGESNLSVPSEIIHVTTSQCVSGSGNNKIISVQENTQPSQWKTTSTLGASSGSDFANPKHNPQSVPRPCSSRTLSPLPEAAERRKCFTNKISNLPPVD